MTSTRDGKTTSKINYVRMQKFSKKNLIKFFNGVEIEFYDSDGLRTSIAKGAEAEFDESRRLIHISGNVRVKAKDGLNLRTAKLTWDEARKRIMSAEFVNVVTAENDTINGIGFESDEFCKSWSIKRPWGITQKNLNLKVMDADSGSKSNENQ